MKPLFLVRLFLDLVAASLLLGAMAYYWSGNALHEMMGTAMFLLLVAHNIFNRRWYGTITKGRGAARGIITKTVNLSLLASMLTLLVTSVIISQSVFSFLPLNSTFTARQVHVAVAYVVLLITAVHLGMHWTLIMGIVRARLGIQGPSLLRTSVLRGLAATIAAAGVYALFEEGVVSKLLMQLSMEFPSFSTLPFLANHIAIVGLFACLAHYGYTLFGRRLQRRT
ncbi:DUF4405 domain-containing protein [Phyllobacterium sp. SYP-B3895]|uniref:DUF4405 domain-containing protein n=1 Tax=Phyllobacterium sp. SYP-B3895 TaxID=2663240 RepID=UPI00141D33A4|nr:DUF4405 domain-containing protein [Phyllobacterium sp. SYP-B3895]